VGPLCLLHCEMHWAQSLAGDVQNLLDTQLNIVRLHWPLLDATRTNCTPMHMRGMHMRAIVVECPSSNGSVHRLREHGSVDEEVGGRRQ